MFLNAPAPETVLTERWAPLADDHARQPDTSLPDRVEQPQRLCASVDASTPCTARRAALASRRAGGQAGTKPRHLPTPTPSRRRSRWPRETARTPSR